jgi:flagellar hook-basal body complex protein FliE
MNDVSIRSNLTLPSITQDNAVGIKQESDSKTFGSILKDSISEVNRLQSDANKSIEKLQLNQSASLHETMIAIEKASISFQTMLTVRNKALEAYQEIMRMQV